MGPGMETPGPAHFAAGLIIRMLRDMPRTEGKLQ
jgi:hypothetical protein